MAKRKSKIATKKPKGRDVKKNIEYLELVAPYIGEFKDETFVLKIGGEVIGETLDSLIQEISILYNVGINIVVVPGAGKQISDYSKEIGLKPEIVQGLRVTDKKTLDDAVIPVMGKLNSDIVDALKGYGLDAFGLQRADKPGLIPDLITAEKAPLRIVGSGRRKERVDLGLVGEVVDVDSNTLYKLLNQRYIIVISSLGMDDKDIIYNINADKVAGGVAEGIGAKKLVISSDVKGVYKHPVKRHYSLLVSYMDTDEAKKMIQKETVTEGMIPKLETCIHAVEHGVPEAHVIKGVPYYLIGEVFGTTGTGTMVLSPQGKRVYEMKLKKMKHRG